MSWDERNEISIRECNGISYAFLSWTFGTNGIPMPEGQEYLVNSYTGHEDEMLEQVRRAAAMADVVIMAIHWGTEYSDTPDDHQLYWAQALSDAGVDIIIGNHPHMIQPVEWINGHKTICFYALGNLISAQFDDSLVGMMGAVTVNKKTKGDEKEITLTDVKADLHWTYGEVNTWKDMEVIPFSQLNDDLCPGYQDLYARMSQIITARDDSIQVGGF
jgi:poly-gamma-glutamate synthesis protein (capsule biosynthesis protein)